MYCCRIQLSVQYTPGSLHARVKASQPRGRQLNFNRRPLYRRDARIALIVPHVAWPRQLPQVWLGTRRHVYHGLHHTLSVLTRTASLDDNQYLLQPLPCWTRRATRRSDAALCHTAQGTIIDLIRELLE